MDFQKVNNAKEDKKREKKHSAGQGENTNQEKQIQL